MSLDPVTFEKTKHILRAAEFLRDLVARDVVRMQHLPGKIMVADLLTKAVARVLFASLMDLIRQYAESGVACPVTHIHSAFQNRVIWSPEPPRSCCCWTKSLTLSLLLLANLIVEVLLVLNTSTVLSP